MGRKKLITLAKEFDFDKDYEYYEYIIDSWINGQKQQVISLYKDMKPEDRQYFIMDYITILNDELANQIRNHLLTNF